MAKDKKSRASMREGPLSELFRRTEKGKPEGEAAEPTKAASPDQPQTEAGREPETRVTPTPQERLRSAFSSEIPDDILDAPVIEPPLMPPAPDPVDNRSPKAKKGGPVLRVVGVGGAGVNAVDRMIDSADSSRRNRPYR